MRTAILVLAFVLAAQPIAAASVPLVVAQASAMTAGEVRKVDNEQGKITIRHEPITNLGMPTMTMVFHVKDVAMLDRVKQGDKIQFVAERIDGNLTVVELRPGR